MASTVRGRHGIPRNRTPDGARHAVRREAARQPSLPVKMLVPARARPSSFRSTFRRPPTSASLAPTFGGCRGSGVPRLVRIVLRFWNGNRDAARSARTGVATPRPSDMWRPSPPRSRCRAACPRPPEPSLPPAPPRRLPLEEEHVARAQRHVLQRPPELVRPIPQLLVRSHSGWEMNPSVPTSIGINSTAHPASRQSPSSPPGPPYRCSFRSYACLMLRSAGTVSSIKMMSLSETDQRTRSGRFSVTATDTGNR